MISVIMGVYNGEKTLSYAIDSIINQTYGNWELIICDDCSTDGTAKILDKYSKLDSRIRVIMNKTNLGLAASLNHCLKYVKGEYIARMDCDDISLPSRFEKQLDFLQNNPNIQLVGTYMQEFCGNMKGNIIVNKENPTKYDVPKGAPFFHATIMMHTKTLKELDGYRISNYTVRTEDVDLWYRFFQKSYKGQNLPEALYLVRMDPNAYRRRKLKYMFHASYIIWKGCDLIELPKKYKIYAFKPILSWLLPASLKTKMRKLILK